MSVQYYFNRNLLIKEIREAGFEIVKTNDDSMPFVITKQGKNWSYVHVINDYPEGTRPEDDDFFEVFELEGRFGSGGLAIVVDICNQFGRKFITDNERDIAWHEGREITFDNFDEFEERCLKWYHLKRNGEGIIVIDETSPPSE